MNARCRLGCLVINKVSLWSSIIWPTAVALKPEKLPLRFSERMWLRSPNRVSVAPLLLSLGTDHSILLPSMYKSKKPFPTNARVRFWLLAGEIMRAMMLTLSVLLC